MTPAELAFWRKIRALTTRFTPPIAAAVRRAFELLRLSYSDAEFARLLNEKGVEGMLDELFSRPIIHEQFAGVREAMRDTIRQTGSRFFDQIKSGGVFDTLSPRVIEALDRLDTRVVQNWETSVRETIRQRVRVGLERGETPTQIARDVKNIIGLAPNQEESVRNYRRALEGESGAGSPLDRKLRNTRFDAKVKAGTMTPTDIEKAVESYRKRFEDFNATTNAKTAATDATKLANQLAREDAVRRGILDGSRQFKRWITVGDDRVRDEHERMSGEEVPYDQPYSNGQMVPGDSDYNCRCVSRFFQKPASNSLPLTSLAGAA